MTLCVKWAGEMAYRIGEKQHKYLLENHWRSFFYSKIIDALFSARKSLTLFFLLKNHWRFFFCSKSDHLYSSYDMMFFYTEIVYQNLLNADLRRPHDK